MDSWWFLWSSKGSLVWFWVPLETLWGAFGSLWGAFGSLWVASGCLFPESSSGDGFSFRFRGPGVGVRARVAFWVEGAGPALAVTARSRQGPRLVPVDFDAQARCSGGVGFPSVAYTVQI